MQKESKIYIAGHGGMVGQALCRELTQQGYTNLLTPSREDLDLTRQEQVERFFCENTPEYIFLAAAKVGGIGDNQAHPVDFGYDNTIIALNVLKAAKDCEVKKLLFLGSSCIYPANIQQQPIREESLLQGQLEPTNELYALAKIVGIRMCQAYQKQHNVSFIACTPCNLYGEDDHFDTQRGHVIPSLIAKLHRAKIENATEVVVWSDGSPLREFLHVQDLAQACLFLMNRYDGAEALNVGSGEEITIYDLAFLLKEIIGYEGCITFDTTKPNGMKRKLIDSSKLRKLGWKPVISLRKGLQETYQKSIFQCQQPIP